MIDLREHRFHVLIAQEAVRLLAFSERAAAIIEKTHIESENEQSHEQKEEKRGEHGSTRT
jgi:hypothetical protein